MSLIQSSFDDEEGRVFIKWAKNRLLKNKNCIVVTTGATGSGKTYNDLRKAELLYRELHHSEFPMENCCFSINEFVDRVQEVLKNPKKGEVLILEEAGINAGSGDWQSKVVKMFNYILQSFRSMNVILFMNLPVLSMLSKQSRQLVHLHMETGGIDFENKTILMKSLFHQLNQHSGKSYWKFMRIIKNGRVLPVQRMRFNMPSKELIQKYEIKKTEFLATLTDKFKEDTKDKKKIAGEQAQARAIINIKREQYIDSRRGTDGKIKCLKCMRAGMYANKSLLKCRACGHEEYIVC